MRVLVIGGGIVGLTTGLCLRAKGIDVLVCERADHPRGNGTSFGLWWGGLDVLASCGVLPRLREFTLPSQRPPNVDPRGAVLAEREMAPLLHSEHNLMVRRSTLHRVLVESLGTQALRCNAEFTGYTLTEDGVRAEFADGTSEFADLLVGADGVNSRVRHQLIPDSAASAQPGHRVWRGTVAYSGELPMPQAAVIGHQRTRGGWVATESGELYWFIGQMNSPEETSSAPREQMMRRVANLDDGGWGCPLAGLVAATDPDSVLASQVYAVPALPRLGSERVVLAGDAAHAMSPHIAIGASLGIEDAGLLAHVLDPADVAGSVRRYDADRAPHYLKARAMVEDIAEHTDPLRYSLALADFLRWTVDRRPSLN